MSTATVAVPVTLEQFLEIERNAPDGARFALINGELREYPSLTTRNKHHSVTIIRIGYVLETWLTSQSRAQGLIAGGEARCHIMTDPETVVGLDIAYFSGDRLDELEDETRMFEGPPVLAVEVLSANDTHLQVVERIQLFLKAGVQVVWIADPDLRTITVHRPGQPPRMFSREQTITGGTDLPGFECRVGLLFSRNG